jgi:hypothetical protein
MSALHRPVLNRPNASVRQSYKQTRKLQNAATQPGGVAAATVTADPERPLTAIR